MAEGDQHEGFHELAPWHGHPRYECDQRDTVTTRLDLIVEHVKVHKPRKRLSDVLGPDERPLEVVEDEAAVTRSFVESGNTGATEPDSGDDHEESEL